MSERYTEAENLSEGWLRAALIFCGAPGKKAVHVIVRITNPAAPEDTAIRAAAEGLLEAVNAPRDPMSHYPPIETTRSTIFPAPWAANRPEPSELAAYYRARYHSKPGGLRYFKANERGTYFGRIVAYPRFGEDDSPADQLSETVRKLRDEIANAKEGRGPKRARYEINIYNERCDRNPMSFPCLAHVSIHLDHERRLNLQAIYRNEHIIKRGYGNFLGLAELQRYIAAAVQVDCGELLITIGHGEFDLGKKIGREHLGELWAGLE